MKKEELKIKAFVAEHDLSVGTLAKINNLINIPDSDIAKNK